MHLGQQLGDHPDGGHVVQGDALNDVPNPLHLGETNRGERGVREEGGRWKRRECKRTHNVTSELEGL